MFCQQLLHSCFSTCMQVYYNSSGQSEQAINVTNFNGIYILVSLRPYAVYSIYVIAVTLINDTGELLERVKSETVNRKTLAGGK